MTAASAENSGIPWKWTDFVLQSNKPPHKEAFVEPVVALLQDGGELAKSGLKKVENKDLKLNTN